MFPRPADRSVSPSPCVYFSRFSVFLFCCFRRRRALCGGFGGFGSLAIVTVSQLVLASRGLHFGVSRFSLRVRVMVRGVVSGFAMSNQPPTDDVPDSGRTLWSPDSAECAIKNCGETARGQRLCEGCMARLRRTDPKTHRNAWRRGL